MAVGLLVVVLAVFAYCADSHATVKMVSEKLKPPI